ncbi:MAG: sugar kinase [Thermoproteales archaeon]|nr:sugar kinase [Thermoproteales archaeon]
MLDAIAIGEILIDFIPTEIGDYIKVNKFIKNFGGAPFNYAIALSRLGHKVGAICSVGRDQFGNFLIKTLSEEKVDTSHVIIKNSRTTLAFIIRLPGGERKFFFYRKPWVETADTLLSPNDIDEKYISNAKIIHVSGVGLSHDPSRGAILKALRVAKENDILVSFDPNIRLDIWDSYNEMVKIYDKVFKISDIILLSLDETRILFNSSDPVKVAKRILKMYNPKYLAIKLGPKGAYVRSDDGFEIIREPFPVKVVDTTGAGDAWAAGFEAMLLEGKKLEEAVIVANAVASLKITRIGAITALPTRKEICSFLRKFGYNII